MALPSRSRRRAQFAVLVVALVALAWVVKEVVEELLADGSAVDLGLLQLRLTHNTGVAFSLGAGLPTGVVVAVTGAITLAIAGYAWSTVPTMPPVGVLGLAAVVAGAVTNLVNRAVDGAVTDYFHTGWFPTFNLPDALLTVGVVLVVAATLLPDARDADAASTR
ncbi:signal peptidase II [Pseudonocardia kunmingensis]|uniref:Lipoprotein signal peptidase n=1 Tax=Pseudonocardia kunmingensis TaxID=630975 RepID=A0A543DIL7_9PSEU|nr:signal peptidase II [Pseudonocardia kunmingensis]TQM09172.1 signal peptidase II [Pseudonocardia kunmingensis]